MVLADLMLILSPFDNACNKALANDHSLYGSQWDGAVCTISEAGRHV